MGNWVTETETLLATEKDFREAIQETDGDGQEIYFIIREKISEENGEEMDKDTNQLYYLESIYNRVQAGHY